MIELPRRTLSDEDIVDYVQILKVPYHRSVEMRDELLLEPKMNEFLMRSGFGKLLDGNLPFSNFPLK